MFVKSVGFGLVPLFLVVFAPLAAIAQAAVTTTSPTCPVDAPRSPTSGQCEGIGNNGCLLRYGLEVPPRTLYLAATMTCVVPRTCSVGFELNLATNQCVALNLNPPSVAVTTTRPPPTATAPLRNATYNCSANGRWNVSTQRCDCHDGYRTSTQQDALSANITWCSVRNLDTPGAASESASTSLSSILASIAGGNLPGGVALVVVLVGSAAAGLVYAVCRQPQRDERRRRTPRSPRRSRKYERRRRQSPPTRSPTGRSPSHSPTPLSSSLSSVSSTCSTPRHGRRGHRDDDRG